MSDSFWQRALYKIPNLLFPPHNLREYSTIIHEASLRNYIFFTLQEFSQAQLIDQQPFIILRHDIDSDPQAALKFAMVELQYKVKASYYFRKLTWDVKVINAIHKHGHEIGYHYEEMTDFAKARHLKDKSAVQLHLKEIQQNFSNNLAELRQTVDFDIKGVAAHGDFAWKRLDLGNRFFLRDKDFRAVNNIEYEAYDEPLVAKYCNHVSDKPAPQVFLPESPLAYIKRGESFLFLSHPRWWYPNPWGNIYSDIKVNYQKLIW
ncbi:MAG: hypothetical protein PHO32_00180 [Candidatus Cloacimonetes bacterium]|nr:hypothetical protein [Candidatus Cloacimonadota bacterium]